jgi:hypothetical protein
MRRASRPAPRALLLCAALAALGCSPRQISDSGFGAYEVSLAAWPDGLAIAWYDTRDGNAEVYVRTLDDQGQEKGRELRLTTTEAESYEADIAPLPGAFAVAWYEKAKDGAMRAQLGVWQRDGTPVWSAPIAVGAGSSRNAIVRKPAMMRCSLRGSRPTAAATNSFGRLVGRRRSAAWRACSGRSGETTWNLNAAIAPNGEAWVGLDAVRHARRRAVLPRGSRKASRLWRGSRPTTVSAWKYPDLAFGAGVAPRSPGGRA